MKTPVTKPSSSVRVADAKYVLEWVYQAGPNRVPANIHDLAARALGEPSMTHGCGDSPAPNRTRVSVLKGD